MLVSHVHKFVYMPPPRTGTTSLSTFLRQHYEAFLWDQWDAGIFHYNGDDIKHPKHIVHVPEELKDYFIFGSVRNPYTREISRYFWKVRRNRNVTFDDYVFALKKESNADWYYLKQNAEYMPPSGCVRFRLNAFVRLEHIESDLLSLPFVDRLEHIPKLNGGPTHRHSVGYTMRLARRMREEFDVDFRAFGYDEAPPWECFAGVML